MRKQNSTIDYESAFDMSVSLSGIDLINLLVAAFGYFYKKWPTRSTTCKFVDAGCGLGNVLIVAKAICQATVARLRREQTKANGPFVTYTRFEFQGLEIDEEFLRILGFRAGDSSITISGDIIWRRDITTVDYSGYDMVYYYCPICKLDQESEFERRVEDTMKEGAILIASTKRNARLYDDSRFTRINTESDRRDSGVWLKTKP